MAEGYGDPGKATVKDAGQGFASTHNKNRHLPRPWQLRRLHRDEQGEHSLEVLMILAFGVLPMISAVWLLEDVIREYVAFGQIFITSPFF